MTNEQMNNPEALRFTPVSAEDRPTVEKVSAFVTAVVKEHFDPIIGEEQNAYMLERFQSVPAVIDQIERGARYYAVSDAQGTWVCCISIYPKNNSMYLSKFYIDKKQRGRGYGRGVLRFIIGEARKEGYSRVTLNCNRDNPVIAMYEHWGFTQIAAEQKPIGSGYIMDDFVFEYQIPPEGAGI